MRIQASIASISWLPSDVVPGVVGPALDVGAVPCDAPPAHLLGADDLARLFASGRFRFASRLQAWVEVTGGRIVDHGAAGGGFVGSSGGLGPHAATVATLGLPAIRPAPDMTDDAVRSVQTCGDLSGVPVPRTVSRVPFVQIAAPVSWTTLALTIHADGRVEHDLLDASPFPRHRVYDTDGLGIVTVGASGASLRNALRTQTPWGLSDSPALDAAVSRAARRWVATGSGRGGAWPGLRRIPADSLLGDRDLEADEVLVLVEGVLGVEIDGGPVAELVAGAVLDTHMLKSGPWRLRPRTDVTVAAAPRRALETGQTRMQA